MPFFGRKKQNSATSTAGTRRDSKARREPGINGIYWLGLKTVDITGETLFLERAMGLKHRDEGNTGLGHHVLFDCGPLQLELVEGRVGWAHQPKPRRGAPDVPLVPSFLVDNLQEIYNGLHEKEVSSTQIFDQGWVSSLLLFDTERNLWQISQIHNAAPAGTGRLDNLGVLWLAVHDMDKQLRFYHEMLGLPLSDLDLGQERPITERAEQAQEGQDAFSLVENNERKLGALFFREGTRLALTPGGLEPEPGAVRVWGKDTAFQIGFRGQNLAELAQVMREKGVSFSGPSYDAQLGYWLTFTDPEGNVARIVEPFALFPSR